MPQAFRQPYAPRPQFMPYHERDKRWTCIVAHRRAGKTVAVVNDAVTRALYTSKKDARYAYIAPYYGQAKMIAWDYLKKGTEGVQDKILESELSVRLVNGSLLRLFGADNIDSLRGIYLDGVILDEFADMNPSVWGSVIRPLLADRRGWATFIGTPKGHNAFYDVREHARKDDEWHYMELKASETGLIDEDELADARKSMTADQYNQEFECDFEAAVMGAYYGEQMKDAEREGRITTVALDPEYRVHTFWDIGRNDNSVIWFAQEVAQELRILDVYGSSGQDIEHYVRVLDEKGYNYDTHYLPHDAKAKTLATKRSVIEQLAYDHGLKCRIVPRLSVQDGIQATRKLLPRCWFDAEKCYVGIEALKLYQKKWDDEGKRYMDRPLHNWASDYADAFRQLALSIGPADAADENVRRSRAETYSLPTLAGLWEERDNRRSAMARRIS